MLALLLAVCAAPVLAQATDDTIYVVSNNTTLSVITNQNTGTIGPVTGGTLLFGTSAAARDPLTGRVYYLGTNDSSAPNGKVAYWDPATTTNTLLNNAGSPAGENIVRLAFNTAGTLYGIGQNSVLYTISRTTGAYTQVGTQPVVVTNKGNVVIPGRGDIAFTSNGTLYAASDCTGTTNGASVCLFTINTAANPTAVEVGPLTTLTGGAVMASLAVGDNDVLYAGASNGNYYGVNTATGAGTLLQANATAQYWDFASMTKFANLSVVKAASGTFAVGRNAAYTLTVRNNGPSSASGPLVVSDTLPSGLSFVSGTGTGWTCSALSGVVTCDNPGPLANATNSVITLTVGVTAPAAPNVTNTATVSGTTFDSVLSNNSSTVTTPVLYITVVKSVNPPPPGPYAPGTDLTYTITFKNEGNVAASSFIVYDDIPAQTYFKVASQTSPGMPLGTITGVTLTYVGGTPTSGGGGAPAGYDARITRITWTFTGGALQPGLTGTVTFIARIR
jgi:uncharacterized repeat protein (TIGR01451 family)